MCGIVGAFRKMSAEKVLELMSEGFYALKHRGEDSYGVVLKSGDTLLGAKAMYSDEFLQKLEKSLKEKEIKEVDWFIAHNRKASVGNVTVENAHPVWDEDASVFVVQNGTKKSLAEVLSEARSDTHAILLFSLHTEQKLLEKLLEKTGVVFIVDAKRKTVFFHRDSSRSLAVEKERGVFASEPVFSGSWGMVIPQNSLFSFDDFSLKADRYSNLVLYRNVGTCGSCRKVRRVLTKAGVCSLCALKGKNERAVEEVVWSF